MLVDQDKIKSERLNRAWSQEQLAQASGMGLRTIQRIEAEGRSSLESTKALAAVFGMSVADLQLANSLTLSKSKAVTHWLSSRAKVVALSLFIISFGIALLMVWSEIPPFIPIYQLQQVLAPTFPYGLLTFINVILALVVTLSSALLIGLVLDCISNQGLYAQVKTRFKSGQWSIRKMKEGGLQHVICLAEMMRKPMTISVVFFICIGVLIYLDLENYQKERLIQFLSR